MARPITYPIYLTYNCLDARKFHCPVTARNSVVQFLTWDGVHSFLQTAQLSISSPDGCLTVRLTGTAESNVPDAAARSVGVRELSCAPPAARHWVAGVSGVSDPSPGVSRRGGDAAGARPSDRPCLSSLGDVCAACCVRQQLTRARGGGVHRQAMYRRRRPGRRRGGGGAVARRVTWRRRSPRRPAASRRDR